MMISWTGDLVRNLKFLRSKARTRAPKMPTNTDFRVRAANSHPISRGEFQVKGRFEVVQIKTALNKMIDTASFTIPSPNTMEYSMGYSSNLMIETAATVSEQHITAENNRISYRVSLKGW